MWSQPDGLTKGVFEGSLRRLSHDEEAMALDKDHLGFTWEVHKASLEGGKWV